MAEPKTDRERATSRVEPHALRALAERRDPLGILSVYVDADPRAQAAGRPPWAIELDDRLKELTESVRRDGPRERWEALGAALERVAPLLDEAADPATSGRARVVFASLSSDWTVHRELQLPTTTEVTLDQGPRIRPLVRLFRDGAPAGAVLLARDRVEWFELRLGRLDRLGGRDFGGAAPDSRRKKGPAGDNPAHEQQSAPQRDRFEDHVEDRRERFISSAAAEILEVASTRGWDELLLTGDPRLAGVMERAVEAAPAPPRRSVLDLNLGGLQDAELAAWMLGELAELRSERRREAAQHVIGAAAQGRDAATVADVLDALAEGRVETLFYDENAVLEGARMPDGRLVPHGPAPAELGASEEPLLIERMIEMALATDAAVVPLSGAEPEGLDDGVGARLRW